MSKLAWLLSALLTLCSMSTASQDRAQDERKDAILRRFADEFIAITPGKDKYPASFTMGSKTGPAAEQPAHEVTLRCDFAVCKYEVTQELYQVATGRNQSRWKGPRNSVEMVSWDEANEFCRRATTELRQRKLLRDDEEMRLPSEAEWEYLCRAGTTTAFSFGDHAGALTDFAWFTGNARGNDPPVGAKKPNPWGFYDLHGYVWEWCSDVWHPDYKDAPTDGSPRRADQAKERVLRGGAWTTTADQCRSAFRGHRPAETRGPDIGLRCVRAKVPQGKSKT